MLFCQEMGRRESSLLTDTSYTGDSQNGPVSKRCISFVARKVLNQATTKRLLWQAELHVMNKEM